MANPPINLPPPKSSIYTPANPQPVYLFPASNTPVAPPAPSDPTNPKTNFPKPTPSLTGAITNFPKSPPAPKGAITNFTKMPSVFRPTKQNLGKSGTAYNPMSSTDSTKGWPLAKFYFEVSIDWMGTMGFQTCEGLEATVEAYEFRDGNSTTYYKEKRPGLTSFGNITLKKGMFERDDAMYRWFKNVSAGAFFGDLRTVKITLKDEIGQDMYIWTVNRAFVVKYTPTSMDAGSGDEVAIEEMELACQSWTMDAGAGLFGGIVAAATSAAAGISGAINTAASLVGANTNLNLSASISGSINI
jgi:phage tail-like protein